MAEEPECDFNEDKPGIVRIRIRIPGIKPGRGGIMSKPKQAESGNAEIEGPLFNNDNQGVTLHIHDRGGLDGTSYRYHVEKLPSQIVPAGSKVEVEKDWVFLYLKKEKKDKSWESNFRSGTLETA